jgi:hypothetical protein
MEEAEAMNESTLHHALIRQLGGELAPVRRLRSPLRRSGAWLAALALLAAALLAYFGDQHMLQRWRQSPDLGWAALAAVLTTISAAFVALMLAVPGRSSHWAWLPLPPALWWLGASGIGCLRQWLLPGAAPAGEGLVCLYFIVGFSVPLSALMVWLLRRACPLRPRLTAAMAGLASATGSAALLEICHSADAAFTDLAVHVLAIGLVIALNGALGQRLLQQRASR